MTASIQTSLVSEKTFSFNHSDLSRKKGCPGQTFVEDSFLSLKFLSLPVKRIHKAIVINKFIKMLSRVLKVKKTE